MKAWGRIQQVGIVPLREIFTQSGALFFLHDHVPGAKTLKEAYLDQSGPRLSQAFLWDVAVSVVAAIRTVHSMQMALRCISATRILLAGHGRIWLGSCGIMDVLEFESTKGLTELQREDLKGLGTVLLELSCGCSGSARSNAIQNSLKLVASRGYTAQWSNFLWMLLSPQPLQVQQVVSFLGVRCFQSLSNLAWHADVLENLLHQQMENGRMLMLLLKMGMINDRPRTGGQGGGQWAETGNVYMLKLFHDFLFHQVDDENKTVADFGHTIGVLNKLDMGVDEQVV